MAQAVTREREPYPRPQLHPAAAWIDPIAEAIPDGFVLVRDDRIVWANARFVEMCGRGSLPRLLGTPRLDLFEDTGHGLPSDHARRALECALQRPDGEGRTVVCRPVWPESAEDPGAWVIEDMTHVRVLETELLRATQELQAALRELESGRERLRAERSEREELLSVVSHELRTPVTVIRGYNRLLLSGEVGDLNPEQERFLEESSKSCQRLDNFIGNLLEASRESKGDEVLEIGVGALGPLIDGVIGSLAPLLEENRITARVSVSPEAERARFDPMRLEQILTNLVGNAIRHGGPGGQIEIVTRKLPPVAGDPPRVEICVSDEGPGIASEDRERIFRPYVQAGSMGRAGGLGLGLAICRRLVDAHGGSIDVVDRPGPGSCFRFTLIASDPANSDPANSDPANSETSVEETEA
jgi:signal transduction histidine kinase